MNTYTDIQLLQIAQNQKRILWLILLSLVVVISGFSIRANSLTVALFFATVVMIGIIATWLIYRLGKAMAIRWLWLYIVCAFIPYLNTATLLLLNFRATSALQRRGVRVGLMGVSKMDLEFLTLSAQSTHKPQ